MRRLPHIIPALLSGILLGLTTIGNGPFYHVHWAIFFGFVPLWATWLGERSVRTIFWSGWVCQFVFTLIAFHWLAYTVNEFSHMGLAFSTLVLLFYCAIANLQFPLAGVAWHYLFHRDTVPAWLKVTSLALLTALFQRMGTMIFHWNFGYAWLYMGWPGMQLADIAGFRWLCTVSILLNAAVLLTWFSRKETHWWKPAAIGLGTFALLNLLGWVHERGLPAADSVAKVLLIQPNIGNRAKEKLDHGEENFREVILLKYIAQTEVALHALASPPDFAIWPENAFPSAIADKNLTFGIAPLLGDFLRRNRLALLTGSFGIENDQITNSLFSLNQKGTWSSTPYNKIYLLPFGEYVPFSDTFPKLKEWLPDVRDYGRGAGPLLLESGGMQIGPQICYEGLFDSVARDLANLGAQLIVNVTNDSWYGHWMEPWQHFYITMAKAVENRRPLLRATNTGLSGVILANGKILEMSPPATEWHGYYEVPYLKKPRPTVFMGWGYWIDWVFLACALLACLAARLRKPRV